MDVGGALLLAYKLHDRQVDKQGEPYVLHLFRVAGHMMTDEGRIAALLHDAVEDGRCEMGTLERFGVPAAAIEAIEAVTIRVGESYEDFILRAGRHPLGRLVKIADLYDNLDPARSGFNAPTARDEARNEKYRRALAVLRGEDP